MSNQSPDPEELLGCGCLCFIVAFIAASSCFATFLLLWLFGHLTIEWM